MANDIFGMTPEDYSAWIASEGIEILDLSKPSEENLCRLVSNALRSIDNDDKATAFIDIANMSLALADKTLGAQRIVPQCLVLQQH